MEARLKHLAIPTYALLGIVWVVFSGFQENGYYRYVLRMPMPQPYPLSDVLYVIAIISVEALAIYGVIRPSSYHHSFGRSLISFAIASALVIFWALGLIHSAPFCGAHFLWVLVGAAALFVLSCFSAFLAWRQAHNKALM
jgi:hypothetical protein